MDDGADNDNDIDETSDNDNKDGKTADEKASSKWCWVFSAYIINF